MRPWSFLIVTILALHGCQAAEGLSQSTSPPGITGPAASAIAGDMAGRYAEQAGSVKAPLKLRKDTSDFAIALEAALRGWGYSVMDEDKQTSGNSANKPVSIAYSLVEIDGQVLARLSSDTVELGRAYSVSNGVATPVSPLSLMKRSGGAE